MSGAIPLRKALADLASRPVEEQAEVLRSLVSREVLREALRPDRIERSQAARCGECGSWLHAAGSDSCVARDRFGPECFGGSDYA